jgi:hypothetical protein
MTSVEQWWPLCAEHTALVRAVMSDVIAEVRGAVPTP